MTVVIRAVGTVRSTVGSNAASSVRCTGAGLTSSRVSVGVVSRSSGARVRCQAAAVLSTSAVRELATADHGVVVEREQLAIFRCVEESRATLRGSYEAASVSGVDESRFLSEPAHCEQSRMYYGRRGGGDAHLAPVATVNYSADDDDDQEDVQVWMAAVEAALQGAGRNAETLCELATRAWRKLGDADRAEELFMAALQLAPHDSAIQASYAQFLWQCDAA